MSKSILQNEKCCFVTKSTLNLHKHHVMHGNYRSKAEKYGLWVWLRSDWHIQTPYAVHNDAQFDLKLKRLAQREFENRYGHEKWIKEFHKNYLEGHDE